MTRPPTPLGHLVVYRYGPAGRGHARLAWLLHWSPSFAQVRVVGSGREVGLTAAQTAGMRAATPDERGHVAPLTMTAPVKEAA